jgi:hypothetical protein
MPILSAASPVEIEASADSLALPAPARAAALALFHGLTSREELTALSLPAAPGQRHDGAEWPAHRFLFGTAAELAPSLDALRQRPDVAEIGSGDAPEGLVPRTLLLTGGQDGFFGALLACSDPGRLAEVMAELGVSDAG